MLSPLSVGPRASLLVIAALLITSVVRAELTTIVDAQTLEKVQQKPSSAQVTITAGDEGIHVTAAKGDDQYPGLTIEPKSGEAWDLSKHAYLDAELVNTGDTALRLHLRADNAGDWRKNPWSINAVHLKPGESATLRTHFGESYGNPAYALDASKVVRVLVFAEKPKGAAAFRVQSVQAGGEPIAPAQGGAMTPAAEGETAKLLVFEGEQKVGLKPSSAQVTTQVGQSGIDAALFVEIEPGNDGYPGVAILPGGGSVWDLGAFGHVVAEISNTGDHATRVQLRVDNAGDWRNNPWNTEATTIKPGETKPVKVIFGYGYGYKPNYKLDPSKVTQVLLFTDKAKNPISLRVNAITAGGPAGEKPPVKPENVRVTPKGGIMLGAGVQADKDLSFSGKNTEATVTGEGVDVAFSDKDAYAVIRPALGKWRLTDALQVEVTVRNIGDAPVTPEARAHSDGSKSPAGSVDEPLAPGQSATLVATFASGKPWIGPDQLRNGHLAGQPNTGNSVLSDRISAVTLSLKEATGTLRIEQIKATAPVADTPDWLGKRPPVEGDWAVTFEDDFDGERIDLDKWNIHTANYWDTRSHFSRDNVILQDGKVHLRYEKKRGYINDDPEQTHPKTGKNETDYAVGYLDTYDKFTQTYGYFEARMKLPEAPGLWPAFWTMPDRGDQGDPENWPRWKRSMTEHGGMEFDILEHLTRWGPYRYNIAFHWDGYGKNHKATGSTAVYAAHDKDGYITAGMLWLPGKVVYYANGREVARWENERVCSVPSYPILYMVSGGWDNNALDDAQLPADFVIDYIRVWQREDLRSNAGGKDTTAARQ